MKYLIVSGSTRINSQSFKVSSYIKEQLKTTGLGNDADIIDLSNKSIPDWDEGHWEHGDDWNATWTNHSKELKLSDAIIIVVPEWGGMVPPALKNFFQLCTNGELAHKPSLIVSISAGITGGSYPVAELRMSSYKNTKICYIPDHIIIKNVTQVLDNSDQVNYDDDIYIKDRIFYSLNVLNIYAKAFKQIRDQEIIDQTQYKYGM